MLLRWPVITLMTLSSVIIPAGAGHAFGPLWFFIITGWQQHWIATAVFSLIGYGSLVAGLMLSSNHKMSYPYLTTAGCCILLAASCAAISSDQLEATIIWSIPMIFFSLVYQIIAWSGDGT